MEHGSALGTYLAYGVIGVFLIGVTFFVARSLLLTSLLLVAPIRQVLTWLGLPPRTGRRTATRDETRSTSEARRIDDQC